MNNDLISRSELIKTLSDLVVGGEERIKEAGDGNSWVDGIHSAYREINNAPTVPLWHPFTEEPEEEGQYLVQHYYKTWSGKIIITYEVFTLEELMGLIRFNNWHSNRDNHYQAWQKIEPYEEEENE